MCIKCNSNKNWIENIVFVSVFFAIWMKKGRKISMTNCHTFASWTNPEMEIWIKVITDLPHLVLPLAGWLTALHDISYIICATAEVQVALMNDLFWEKKTTNVNHLHRIPHWFDWKFFSIWTLLPPSPPLTDWQITYANTLKVDRRFSKL